MSPVGREQATLALRCGKYFLDLGRPLIMGVVNVTPDSFSDGGHFYSVASAVAHARQLIEEGADLIDIGGESTRPGASEVTLEEERRRVLPVLEGLSDVNVPISIDTRKPALMREAIAVGASMINDIEALHSAESVEAVAGSAVAVCLMHKRGTPANMQLDPRYDDAVADVAKFLAERVAAACAAGVTRDRLIVDPGFGFGKTLQHNLQLLRGLGSIAPQGVALLAGLSRKSMLGQIIGRAENQRVFGSVAAALIAAQHGAHILRVHDVAATRDALEVWQAVRANSA